jgi:hypothetical protein
LFLRWRGHTNLWESLYILPAGFGTGIAQAATFISTQAAVDKKYKAVATAGLYLTMQVGVMVGLASASAVMLEGMRRNLDGRLIMMGIGTLGRNEVSSIQSLNTRPEKANLKAEFADPFEPRSLRRLRRALTT